MTKENLEAIRQALLYAGASVNTLLNNILVEHIDNPAGILIELIDQCYEQVAHNENKETVNPEVDGC